MDYPLNICSITEKLHENTVTYIVASEKEKMLKMDFEKKKFQKMFPNLAKEITNKNCGTKINSVRSDTISAEKAVSKKFTNYTPDVIDFLRRCDKPEQAEEIICYLVKRQEITTEYAKKLKKQHDHVASVLLTYALVQLHMKKRRLKTPEEAIRRCKTKNANSLMQRFLDQINL